MSEQPLFFIDTNPENNEQQVVTKVKAKNTKTLGADIEKKDYKKRGNDNFKKKETKKEKLIKDEKNLSNLLFGSATKPVVESEDSDSDEEYTSTNILATGSVGSAGEDNTSSSEGSESDDSSEDEKDHEIAKPKTETEGSGDEEDIEIKTHNTESGDNETDKADENNEIDGSNSDASGDSDSSDDSSDDEKGPIMLPEDIFGNNLVGVSRKRKAAWHDEADEKVLVKDLEKNAERTGTYKQYFAGLIPNYKKYDLIVAQ